MDCVDCVDCGGLCGWAEARGPRLGIATAAFHHESTARTGHDGFRLSSGAATALRLFVLRGANGLMPFRAVPVLYRAFGRNAVGYRRCRRGACDLRHRCGDLLVSRLLTYISMYLDRYILECVMYNNVLCYYVTMYNIPMLHVSRVTFHWWAECTAALSPVSVSVNVMTHVWDRPESCCIEIKI